MNRHTKMLLGIFSRSTSTLVDVRSYQQARGRAAPSGRRVHVLAMECWLAMTRTPSRGSAPADRGGWSDGCPGCVWTTTLRAGRGLLDGEGESESLREPAFLESGCKAVVDGTRPGTNTDFFVFVCLSHQVLALVLLAEGAKGGKS